MCCAIPTRSQRQSLACARSAPLRQRFALPPPPQGEDRKGVPPEMDFISILSIFVMACFVGYYVVWSVTPALHTPLMSVTNAISSVIVVGALIASAAAGSTSSKWLGLGAVGVAGGEKLRGLFRPPREAAVEKKAG